MPKNSFLQALFKGPKFSLAPIEKRNRGSLKIGTVVPIFANVLNPREGVELNMSHLVRFLPAKAPVMEGYKVTFDAFAVPFSALGYAERKERDIDDFFNLQENGGLIQNPFCFPMSDFNDIFIDHVPTDEDNGTSAADVFAKHSLGDYLNFPSLKAVRDHVRKWLRVNPLAYGSNIQAYYEPHATTPLDSLGYSVGTFVALAFMNDPILVDDIFGITIDLSGRGHGVGFFTVGVPFCTSSNPLLLKDSDFYANPESDIFFTSEDDGTFGTSSVLGAYSLLGYILRNYSAVASYYGFPADGPTAGTYLSDVTNMANHIAYLMDEENPISLDYLQVLYDNYGIDAQSIYDEYFEYIMSLLLYRYFLVNGEGNRLYNFPVESDAAVTATFLPSLPDDEPVDLSYFAAYWKIISDWYINTNIDGDPDDFFVNHCRLLSDGADVLPYFPEHYVVTKPFVRRWANDVFTSAVPEALVQNVKIPVDGTIPDLRDANAFQKLKDILRNTGSRLRDVVYGLRGVLPSAVRSEMSEPIATLSTWVGFQSVLQTSQTTSDSPQAAYSGIGTDSKGFAPFLKYVNNDEPTPVIVMVLMSVTQHASYFQGFDRKFFRKSIYDFAIPQLAMVGEQEVTNKEVYFDKDFERGIFGFNRRYYDWFMEQSEVHGELRESLDYWHGARFFDEQPYLGSEFIGINSDVDHLQRIFANTSESAAPIVYNVSFDGYFTRALPRYIQYEL